MAKITTAAQIAKLEKQLEVLKKKQASASVQKQRIALDKIVRLAASADLTLEMITEALEVKPRARRAKTNGKEAPAPRKPRASKKAGNGKVAPKYRNPENPEQTWTGRGKPPAWVAALRNTGNLDAARIAS